MSRFSSMILVLSLLFQASCSQSDRGISGVVVRDSSGVRIVENSLDALNAAPEWGLSQTLQLGALDGLDAERFYEVNGAVLSQG
ncbi:MAG: hypothetical protein MUO50_18165, partial [Longimicrobiales bacterium]|nr:hypothetical protein [Longimicrobiales bacterium]